MMQTTRLIMKKPILSMRQMTRLYHENVVDHYENPRNVGSLDKNKTNVGTGESIRHYPLIRNYLY